LGEEGGFRGQLSCFDQEAKEKKRQIADSLNTTAWIKNGGCFVFCTTQWMQRHTSHLENKRGEAFQWGSGGWEAEACTPPGVLLNYLWGYSMPHLYDFYCGSDCM